MISSLGNRPLILYGSPPLGPGSGSSFTEGSIIFVGPGGDLAQDNTNFFYNDATNQLKVGGSVLTPLIIGGTGTTDDLTLQSTSGVGTTGSWIFFKVGNNGATTAMEINHNGLVGIGTTGLVTLSSAFTVRQANPPDIGYVASFRSNLSAYINIKTGTGANEQAGFTCEQTTNGIEWRFAVIGNEENAFRVSSGATGVLYTTVNGNVCINNANSDPTAGTKCLIFGDGTVPSGLDSNTAGLYANDVAGTVNMFAINEAGGSSQLTGFTAKSVIFASSTGGFTEDTALIYDSASKQLTAEVLVSKQSGGFPRLLLNDTSQAADARLFQAMNSSLTFRIKAVNDAETVAQPGFVLDRNGIMTGAGQPTALVTKSGTQAVGDSTLVAVSFDTETFDVAGCHSGGDPTKLTVPTGGGGVYFIFGTVVYPSNSTGIRLARLRKGGAGAIITSTQQAVNGEITAIQVVAIAQLSAAEYVELIAYQTSTGSLNIETSCNFGWIKVW